MSHDQSSAALDPAHAGRDALCNRCGSSCCRSVRTTHLTCPECGGFEWTAMADTVDEQRRREAIVSACQRCDDAGSIGEAPLDPPQEFGVHGAEVAYEGGYLSDPLKDGTSYSFVLCESCLVWLFGQFVLPVTAVDLLSDPPKVDIEESARVTELGGRHLA